MPQFSRHEELRDDVSTMRQRLDQGRFIASSPRASHGPRRRHSTPTKNKTSGYSVFYPLASLCAASCRLTPLTNAAAVAPDATVFYYTPTETTSGTIFQRPQPKLLATVSRFHLISTAMRDERPPKRVPGRRSPVLAHLSLPEEAGPSRKQCSYINVVCPKIPSPPWLPLCLPASMCASAPLLHRR